MKKIFIILLSLIMIGVSVLLFFNIDNLVANTPNADIPNENEDFTNDTPLWGIVLDEEKIYF